VEPANTKGLGLRELGIPINQYGLDGYPIFLHLTDFLWARVSTCLNTAFNHLILFLIAGIDFK
jgi:hypothetical protein